MYRGCWMPGDRVALLALMDPIVRLRREPAWDRGFSIGRSGRGRTSWVWVWGCGVDFVFLEGLTFRVMF